MITVPSYSRIGVAVYRSSVRPAVRLRCHFNLYQVPLASQLLVVGILDLWNVEQGAGSSRWLRLQKSHRNFFAKHPERAKPKGRPWPWHTFHTQPRLKPPLSVVPPTTVLPTQRDAAPWCMPSCFSSCCAKVISRNISCSTWLFCWALIARVH